MPIKRIGMINMFRTTHYKRLAAALTAACVLLASSCGGNEQPADTSVTAEVTTVPPETTTTTRTTMAPIITTTTTTTLPPLTPMTADVPGEHSDYGDSKTYEDFYNVNNDMIGWINIEIPGEEDINEPVVQYEDNKYYLTHDFYGKEVKEGAIFADYKCKFTTRTRPANIVLYGHNMASGKSFAKLTRYCVWNNSKITGQRLGISQYVASPTITFDTIWEKGTYKVFAAIFVNTETKNGSVFQYYKQRKIPNEAQFFDYIGNIMDRSMICTDVDLEYGDELLTLSTCYYPLGKENADTRFVVFARRVREGESTEVDTSKAYENPSPLYFDYYYTVRGGSWGGRNWDTSKVKGFDEYVKAKEAEQAAAAAAAPTA